MRTFLMTLLFAVSGAQAANIAPDQSVRAATDELQANIKQHRGEYTNDSAKFYKMVDETVVPHFDTKAIGQQVLGRNWRQASDEQRTRFVSAFKNSLVHSYADALLKYSDSVKLDWKASRAPAADAKETTVQADLVRQQGPPIPLGFSVHDVDNDWKIYDVVIDGVSLGMTFRSQFNQEIKTNGLDGLISRLEKGGKPLQDESAVKKGKS
jgi:phospholipid transport system substrate-binding protein